VVWTGVASQAERIRDSVAALCDLWQREDTSVGIECSSTPPWILLEAFEHWKPGS